ncbi:hypothetical protein WJX84_003213 [Apatococcus fuscideae]|uniref:Uncharacterized protein n=1 Tax=Apatococcus fuscideae TaxID=2026836 RepID=A0AAW1SKB9_9CHLO
MHRAELLASDVRRLGMARGNLSYLDFCGVLVSEIGNALGLLRMAQQGRLQLASTIASGIPGLNGGQLPTPLDAAASTSRSDAGEMGWDAASTHAEGHAAARSERASRDEPEERAQGLHAAGNEGSVAWAKAGLQDRLRHLHDCIVGGLDPMADLASGLQAVLQGPLQQPEVRRPPGSEGGSPRQASSDGEEPSAAAQGTGAAPRQLRRQSSPPAKGAERGWPHLALFHVAMPAMTLGAVQRLLLEQEQLSRSRRPGHPSTAAFADGGFPLGLAFLLQALQQEPAFEALRWFQSVREHYTAQRREAEASGQGRGAARASSHWGRMGWLSDTFGHEAPRGPGTRQDTNTLLRLKRVQACRDGFASLQHGLNGALGLLPPLSHLHAPS